MTNELPTTNCGKLPESNLSNKIWSSHEIKVKLADSVISVSNIKEAVKQLKESICECSEKRGVCNNCDEIARIFGDKLVEESHDN